MRLVSVIHRVQRRGSVRVLDYSMMVTRLYMAEACRKSDLNVFLNKAVMHLKLVTIKVQQYIKVINVEVVNFHLYEVYKLCHAGIKCKIWFLSTALYTSKRIITRELCIIIKLPTNSKLFR